MRIIGSVEGERAGDHPGSLPAVFKSYVSSSSSSSTFLLSQGTYLRGLEALGARADVDPDLLLDHRGVRHFTLHTHTRGAQRKASEAVLKVVHDSSDDCLADVALSSHHYRWFSLAPCLARW
jgi:hypothetical protein